MKKIILRWILFVVAALFFFQPFGVKADVWQTLVLDRDGDGIPDHIETAGWFNASGGPYKTKVIDPDSDGDGLTDGEEKLFDTQPLNAGSPGAYVEYHDSFKTRQYFHGTNNEEPRRDGGGPNPQTLGGGYLHWDEGGFRRLLTEGVVVRRGTTFLLKGPPGAELRIEKLRSSQSNLNATPNFCQGGWDIRVDDNETVGIYTAVLTKGEWRDELPIYVIFELPTPHDGNGINKITQDDVEAFLYDDNPANLRDETVIWWNPRGADYNYPCNNNSGPCDNEPYRYARGFMQGFPSDQFRKYVFRDRVMPVVSGASDQTNAIKRIADKADTEIRVNFDVIRVSMFDALRRFWDGSGYTQVGGACDANASVFSGFGRSAGVMIKPFIVDWNTGNRAYHGESSTTGLTDTSALVWSDNQWRGMRSYARNEQNSPELKYYPFTGGVKPLGSIFKWYSDQQGDLMLTQAAGWQMSNVNLTLDPLYEFSTNELFTTKWDYYWDSRRPLAIQKDPSIQTLTVPVWKGDPWTPNDWGREVYVLPNPYPGGNLSENWPIEPLGYLCSPGTAGNCPFNLTRDGVEPLPEAAEDDPQPLTVLPGKATFNGSYSHRAADSNGDGTLDALVVELGLSITEPGTFLAEAELYDAEGEWIGTSTWEGSGPTVQLQFENAAGRPGPYVLRYVYLSDGPGSSSDSLGNLSLKPLTELYHGNRIHIGTLSGDGLSPKGTTITPTLTFNHSTPDEDGDGKKDALIVTAGMAVSQAGNYRLEGWLVAANGQLVAWTQSAPIALEPGNQSLSLYFDGRLINNRGLAGPYTIQELKVLNGNTGAFVVLDEVQQTGLKFQYNPNQFETTLIFTDNLENGSGKWSNVDPDWSLVDNNFFSRSHAWRANVGNSANESLTTIAINTTNYAKPVLRFQSCTQASGGAQGFVEASTDGGLSWTEVGVSGAADQAWLTKEFNLHAFGKKPNVQLRFRANTGASGSFKWSIDDVRLNGWPAIANLSIARTPPQPLSQPNTTVNFRANYITIDNSLPVSFVWRIDGKVVGNERNLTYTFGAAGDYRVEVTVSNPYDSSVAHVYMGNGIPVQSANFTVVQTDPNVDLGGTFTASYLPANATNIPPDRHIKYIWNFGDGNPSKMVTSKTINHTFAANGTYQVTLTVTNGLGQPVVVRKQVMVPFDDDGDGLNNKVEADIGTNPKKADTDGDGLSDGMEFNGYIYQGPPGHPDDGEKITSDPLKADTDGDGLSDGVEYRPNGVPFTHPRDADTDGDGINDKIEAGPNPKIPLNSDGDGLIDGVDTDSDNDGISDAKEWDTDQNASETNDLCSNREVDIDNDAIPNCQDNDADGNGIPNYRDRDSDGDGRLDSDEGVGDKDKDGVLNYLDRDTSQTFLPFIRK